MDDLRVLPPIPDGVERLSISELLERYQIKSGALYQRFKVLGIERAGSGKKAFLSLAQVELMDNLHLHLKQGGTFGDFPDVHQNFSEEVDPDPETPSGALVPKPQSWLADLFKADVAAYLQDSLIKAIMVVFPPQLPPAQRGLELSYLRELEEAYQHGWLITTLNLANLLGLTSSTVAGYGDSFEDAGFRFIRVGKRKGGQIAWRVDKIEPTITIDTQPIA